MANSKKYKKRLSTKKINLIKTEFSKLFCALVAFGIGAYAIWSGVKYYQLTELSIRLSNGEYTVMPPTELAVVCVTGILVSLLSYLCYTGFLKNSLNKNKLSIDNNTGIVEPIEVCKMKKEIQQIVQLENSDDIYNDATE